MIKSTILFFSVCILFAVTGVMIYTFYTAYASPHKRVTITVDDYGEADAEAWIVMPFVIIAAIIGMIFSVNYMLDERRLERYAKAKTRSKETGI